MRQSLSFKIILLLALIQGLGGLFRGFNWVQVGGNLWGQGLLLLPTIGAVAIMRGLFISAVALLYVLFVVGGLLEKSWAWWSCLTAVILNLLLVLSAVVQGAPVVEAIVWSVIPVILLFYFFSKRGSDAVERA
ncbi:MAG: hypothetical protein ACREQ2_09845 [Candidatus Binatia bacterium]